jgi:hypothetical protein
MPALATTGANDGVCAEALAGVGVNRRIGRDMHSLGADPPREFHIPLNKKGDVAVMRHLQGLVGPRCIYSSRIAPSRVAAE